jgi:hypothetical protein
LTSPPFLPFVSPILPIRAEKKNLAETTHLEKEMDTADVAVSKMLASITSLPGQAQERMAN